MSEIEVLGSQDAIKVEKSNKTIVEYFLFDEFEVHKCVIPPHSAQDWHMHEIIEEVIVVTKGTILIKWKESCLLKEKQIDKNMILRVKKSIHNIENCSNCEAEFIVFRMVPTGDSKKEIIKNDKIIFDKSNI